MGRLDLILSAYKRLSASCGDASCVLATIVDLRGAGYRRPGARMMIMADGAQLGSVSGGCLERDVARNAWRWVEGGAQLVDFDTRADAEAPFGRYGTGCEGVITLLLQRMTPGAGGFDVLEELAQAQAAGEAAIVVHRWGGAVRAAQAVWRGGAWRADALFGMIPDSIERAAARALELGRSEGLELGSGEQALIEHVAPPVEVLIVGAGADAQALVEVAAPLGWRLRVASTDAVRLSAAAFYGVERHLLHSAAEVAALAIRPHTRVLLMTHSLTFDREALPALLTSPARFVGLLGPTSRAARLMALLHERGQLPDAQQLSRLRSPVGLDLGGEDAWEVAVSIVAQLVAEAHGRAGGALCGSGAAIHEPHQVRKCG